MLGELGETKITAKLLWALGAFTVGVGGAVVGGVNAVHAIHREAEAHNEAQRRELRAELQREMSQVYAPREDVARIYGKLDAIEGKLDQAITRPHRAP